MKETKETGRKLGQSLSSAFCEDFFERNYYEEDFYRLQGLTGFYNHRSSIISIFATRRRVFFFLFHFSSVSIFRGRSWICAKILSRESPFWRTDYSRKFYSIFLFIPDFLPIFLSFFTIVQIQGGIIKEIDFSKEIPREIPTTNRHFCATQKAKFHVSYLYGSLQFSSTSPHYEMKRQTHSTIWRASSSNFLGQEFSFCQRK